VARHWATRCKTDFEGFAYIFSRDRTAVFVDARPPQDFLADSVACAVNIQPSEALQRMTMAGCRSGTRARALLSLLMIRTSKRKLPPKSPRRPIGASSYFSGTFADLESSRLRIHSWRRCTTTCIVAKTDDE